MKILHSFAGCLKPAFCLAAVVCLSLAALANEYSTHYRYRAFEGTNEPDWVSSYTSPASKLPPLQVIVRGTDTDAFQDFWYGCFGAGRYYACGDDVPENDLTGDFTVTAVLQVLTADPSQTICSTLPTTSPKSGFRFSLANGFLKADAWFSQAAGGQVIRSIVSHQALLLNRWYRVALRLHKDSGHGAHVLQLWIDSAKVEEMELPLGDDVVHSSLDPIFGADQDTVSGALQANVHSIQVDDYALSEFFLQTPIVRDGSRSLGAPSYHDYLGLSDDNPANGKKGADPLERRIYNTWNNADYVKFRHSLVSRIFTPFLNDGYIPQGVAYDKAGDRLFVSMYYKQTEEVVGFKAKDHPAGANSYNPEGYSSIVAEIFLSDYRLGNVFELKKADGSAMAAHVGGLAFWNQHLFVPASNALYLYDISDVQESQFNPATLTGFAPRSIKPGQVMLTAEVFGTITPFDSIAFLDLRETSANSAYLCLGDWEEGTKRTILERSLKYAEETGVFSFCALRTLQETHGDAQGFSVYSSTDCLLRGYLSTSGSSKSSQLFFSTYEGASTTSNGGQTGIDQLLFKGPPGFEDLQLVNGVLWTVSESGGQYYQKRHGPTESAPWAPLFPFIFGMNATPSTPLSEPPALQFTNVSTLGRIDSSHPMVAGFVIENAERRILIRAVGPGLGSLFGLAGAATDPKVTLNRIDGPEAGVIGANNNWYAADAELMAQVGAFPLSPGSKDSAAVFTLQPGTYTVTVSTADGQPGRTLVELYDVDWIIPNGVVNFSTRGWISSGNSFTSGLVAVGTGSVLVRAIGPGLTSAFGIPNTLVDPRLELWPDVATSAASTNDDWSTPFADAMARVGAFPLIVGSKDAALFIDVSGQGASSKSFTLQSVDLSGGQGECLVELYLMR